MKFFNVLLMAGAIANANEVPTSSEPATSVEEPTTSVVSSSEETPSETPNEPTSEAEPTIEDFRKEVESWLSNYLEKDMLTQIISWAVDAGVLGGLFAIYLKYRKYKSKTIGQLVDEIKENVTKQMQDDFKNLSEEQQAKLINGLETLKKSNELVIKALVLAQSKTTESKLALLDLVSESNENTEVKEVAKEVRKEVESNQAQKEKVQEAVKSDYNPID